MGSVERMEREKAALREKILGAAWEVFAEQGYEAATMRRIADKIDYSPTAIYFHFGDKASLIKAVCDRQSLQLAARLSPLSSVPDPVERLRAIARAYVGFARDCPNEYTVMFIRPRPPVGGLNSHPNRGKLETDAYSLLVATVQDIFAARSTPPDRDPHLVAQAVWGAIHGPAALNLTRDREQWVEWRGLEETVDLLIDAVVASLTE